MQRIEDDGKKGFKTLSIDIDYYQSLLDDVDIPDDKKQELVETIWQIVVSFIDLGFGVHPLQQISEDDTEQRKAIARMIDSEPHRILESDEEDTSERTSL